MHFKIDENLPIEIAEILNNAGHDAKTVHNQQLQGTKDRHLIDTCRNERYVLITLDLDFSDIRAYPPVFMIKIKGIRLQTSTRNEVKHGLVKSSIVCPIQVFIAM